MLQAKMEVTILEANKEIIILEANKEIMEWAKIHMII